MSPRFQRQLPRLTLRVAVVACLLLAAIVLGALSGEYPALSAAGVSALVRGLLPLLALGVLHLAVLSRPSAPLAAVAIAGDLALLASAARIVLRGGAPPVAWLAALCALLLLFGAASVARAHRQAIT